MTRDKTAKKTAKVSYKPEITALVKRRATLAAKEVKEVQAIEKRTVIRKMVKRGTTYDKIAARLGLTTVDVVNEVRGIVQSWLTDEALDAPQLREVELQHLRAMKEYAMYMAMPHPMLDDFGKPIMARNCDCCEADDPMFMKPCFIESHNVPAKSPGSQQWMQTAIQLSNRIAAMGGLDAADKLKERIVDSMERSYKGVAPNVIDNL